MHQSKTLISIATLIATLLIGASVFYYYGETKSVYVSKQDASDNPTPTPNPELNIDSDNDGLKDWEEVLWKTDPHKADTDSDGTLDGAEIKMGRNPLIKGPNDKLDTDTITNKINAELENDLTDTEKFSRELFLKMLAARGSENGPKASDFNDFLAETIKKQTDTQKQKVFTKGDVRIATTENTASLKTYGNAVAHIMTRKPLKPLEYELTLVDRATKSGKSDELKKLKDNIAEYTRIQTDLLKVAVPPSAVSLHLAFVNAISGMIYSINGLQFIVDDPIKGLPGISTYGDNLTTFANTLKAFKPFFISKEIVFTNGEDGYRLFSGI